MQQKWWKTKSVVSAEPGIKQFSQLAVWDKSLPHKSHVGEEKSQNVLQFIPANILIVNKSLSV